MGDGEYVGTTQKNGQVARGNSDALIEDSYKFELS